MSECVFNYIMQNLMRKTPDGSRLKDKLWRQGNKFKVVDNDHNVFNMEAYGSYVGEFNKEGLCDKSEYKWIDEQFDGFDGHRIKEFFLLDSSALEEMVNEIANNPNCSFKTNKNDLIKEGIVPQNFSVLAMEDSFCDDEFSSWFLNLMEVPTVFNKKFRNEYSAGNAVSYKSSCPLLISVDFVGFDEKFVSLKEYLKLYVKENLEDKEYNSEIEELLEKYRLVYEAHHKMVGDAMSSEDYQKGLKKWEEAVCYSRLCRVYGLADIDASDYNCGFLINKKTKEIEMAPEFDLEFVGRHSYFLGGLVNLANFSNEKLLKDDKYYKFLYDNIQANLQDYDISTFIGDVDFISKNYPQVMQRFISKIDEITAKKDGGSSKLEKCLNNYCCSNKDSFKSNLIVVRDVCEVFANESQAEMCAEN